LRKKDDYNIKKIILFIKKIYYFKIKQEKLKLKKEQGEKNYAGKLR
jgi:hypothetical protein